MSALFGQVRSDFGIVGELLDRRLVTSDKQKDWKLHILKIAGKGCTLEIQVAQDVFEAAVQGEAYQIEGTITAENGRTKLIAEKVIMMRASSPRGAS